MSRILGARIIVLISGQEKEIGMWDAIMVTHGVGELERRLPTPIYLKKDRQIHFNL